jgi:hypothetical protein
LKDCQWVIVNVFQMVLLKDLLKII